MERRYPVFQKTAQLRVFVQGGQSRAWRKASNGWQGQLFEHVRVDIYSVGFSGP